MSGDLRIGLAGIGVVGSAVLKMLNSQADLIAARAGRRLSVVAVSSRTRDRLEPESTDLKWYDDPLALANDPGVDVVCEVIGGPDGTALQLAEHTLSNKKHLVTANKALLACHGNELATMAEKYQVCLGYEAAVAGGIPVIKTLREGLAANTFTGIYGILNGTCNYILTEMRNSILVGENRDFASVLADAQSLGYAESDPSTDVDGIDAAHKLALLSSLVFGSRVDFRSVQVEGIRHINVLDIQYAERLGYRVKLLGVSKIAEDKVEQSVHPCMVPTTSSVASVDGVVNAIVIHGEQVGNVILEGPGAGGAATASSVVADLIDIARDNLTPPFGLPASQLKSISVSNSESRLGSYYLRLMVVDQPGAIADISACLRDQSISVESMLQHGHKPGEAVPVVLVTHVATESAVERAMSSIDGLSVVLETPRMIRIVNL